MSATNRGAVRQAQDLYPTPLASFEPLIPFLPDPLFQRAGHTVWEPACGDDRLVLAMKARGIDASGNDIQTGYDFLKDNARRHCILTNPPFSLAFEFCQHSVAQAEHVFLLLRLNFLASKVRRPWFTANEPSALFVLSARPRFVDNRSDACDYAWFYWGWLHCGIYHL